MPLQKFPRYFRLSFNAISYSLISGALWSGTAATAAPSQEAGFLITRCISGEGGDCVEVGRVDVDGIAKRPAQGRPVVQTALDGGPALIKIAGAMSYLSCHAYMRSANKLFVAPVIMAESSRSNELALAYAQTLRERGYAGLTAYDPPGTPLPELETFCIVEPTEAAAEAKKRALLKGAAMGKYPMTTLQTEFDPQ
jgi:hypothetical protein